MLSADGLHVSATVVSVEGAAFISAENELPSRLLRERETINYPVATLLDASRSTSDDPSLGALVEANMFRQKLEFLLQVVDQWRAGGGLGCSISGDEQLQWTGSWVKDHAKKVDWITVGRYGGDEIKA